MADIKQAAQWLDRGKSVRSSTRPSWIYERLEDGALFTCDGGIRVVLTIYDLRAEDWEIAE